VVAIEWFHLDQMAQGTVSAGLMVALGTILFGLPYALRELLRRKTNWWLIAFLLLLIPIFHAVGTGVFFYVSNRIAEGATQLADAAASADPASMTMQAEPDATTTPRMFIGLAAGAAGAIGPLLALGLLPWLRARGARPWLFVAALVALAWWGAMGVRLATVESTYDVAVTIFLPWQILFAFFLSHLIKASPPKDAAAP
jgi:hypothetical protein